MVFSHTAINNWRQAYQSKGETAFLSLKYFPSSSLGWLATAQAEQQTCERDLMVEGSKQQEESEAEVKWSIVVVLPPSPFSKGGPAIEAQWQADHSALRELPRSRPELALKQIAILVGRSYDWTRKWAKRLLAAPVAIASPQNAPTPMGPTGVAPTGATAPAPA